MPELSCGALRSCLSAICPSPAAKTGTKPLTTLTNELPYWAILAIWAFWAPRWSQIRQWDPLGTLDLQVFSYWAILGVLGAWATLRQATLGTLGAQVTP